MLRAAILLVIALLPCRLAAADLVIAGKWMVSEFGGRADATDGGGKMTARCPPGALTLEIGDGTMTSTLAMFPGKKPEIQTMTYTVVERSKDSVTVLVASSRNKEGEKKVITAHGTGLTIVDDGSVSKLIPYDPAAVAAELKRIEDGSRPADPLKDQPLMARLGNADWRPVACRRSPVQFDKTGEQIRVAVTADQPKRFAPSALPSLLLKLPTKPGEYPLGMQFNITIVTPPVKGQPTGNAAVTNGMLVVYKVTATAIEFGLTARSMDGDVINGRMTADVSPLTDE